MENEQLRKVEDLLNQAAQMDVRSLGEITNAEHLDEKLAIVKRFNESFKPIEKDFDSFIINVDRNTTSEIARLVQKRIEHYIETELVPPRYLGILLRNVTRCHNSFLGAEQDKSQGNLTV